MRVMAWGAAILVICVAGCGGGRGPVQTGPTGPTVEFRTAGRQIGPFTPAVRVGDLLFLSGKIGTDSAGRLVPGGIGPETRQVMENIRAELARNGSSMDRVVKCTVFLTDMREWGDMNAVYAAFFPNNKPARSALGASGLAAGARVEVECIAAVG